MGDGDGDVMKRTARFLRDLMGFEDGDVYLSPAPLYHAAPLSWTMGVHRLGGTVVLMERFDASAALRLIEEHRVTHSQWVPTMFVRMLKLGPEACHAQDLSSHRAAVHAAAPCPVPVKHQMIEWWGPILYEYYSGTEGAGVTFIDTPDWLDHPGSVGRPLVGSICVLDDDGHELPVGEIGNISFDGSISIEYQGDEAKTLEAWHRGLATIGDVGFIDDEGYLYLTGRRSHMIISGGVNVYPEESENVLVLHPKVGDVAVIGVPDEDLGETVKAVVELVDPTDAAPDTESELIAYCKSRLAAYKCPRSVDFTEALPRLPTGKLYKRLLRAHYSSAPGPG
jgi:long-chain acyl-CoA synthetase